MAESDYVTSDDLVTFLRARLDDDERYAVAAIKIGDAAWHADGMSLVFYGAEKLQTYCGVEWEERAAHIARHDPTRTFREVEAKRRIIGDLWGADGYPTVWTAPRTAKVVLALLALPYSDHPDYRADWQA